MSHDPQSPTDAADFDVERPFCAFIGGTCTGCHGCCDDDADDDRFEDDESEDDDFDCGAWINGKCDWECPHSAEARGLKPVNHKGKN